jgi:hypothetical protein
MTTPWKNPGKTVVDASCCGADFGFFRMLKGRPQRAQFPKKKIFGAFSPLFLVKTGPLSAHFHLKNQHELHSKVHQRPCKKQRHRRSPAQVAPLTRVREM